MTQVVSLDTQFNKPALFFFNPACCFIPGQPAGRSLCSLARSLFSEASVLFVQGGVADGVASEEARNFTMRKLTGTVRMQLFLYQTGEGQKKKSIELA